MQTSEGDFVTTDRVTSLALGLLIWPGVALKNFFNNPQFPVGSPPLCPKCTRVSL